MDNIFISYSKKDSKWLAEVKMHLSILEHKYQLEIWDDTKIKIGNNWQEDIFHSIKRCKVAILLVSNNFLASEFILKRELPAILNKANIEGLVIFNVILDFCSFKESGLDKYQCLNDPRIPLEELKAAHRKRELVKLTTQLKETIDRPQNALSDVNETPYSIGMLLVLMLLIKVGPKSITEIQNSITSLRRKTIFLELEKLVVLKHVEKVKDDGIKKPSTKWKGTEEGKIIFSNFEKTYLQLSNKLN